MYIDKLAETVNKYNNTYHITIKMKPADVKLRIYIYFKKENNKEDPKFEVGGHVKISTHKSIFAKIYTQNWSEEAFVIKKVKNTAPRTYVTSDLNGEDIAGTL